MKNVILYYQSRIKTPQTSHFLSGPWWLEAGEALRPRDSKPCWAWLAEECEAEVRTQPDLESTIAAYHGPITLMRIAIGVGG